MWFILLKIALVIWYFSCLCSKKDKVEYYTTTKINHVLFQWVVQQTKIGFGKGAEIG